METAYVGLGSNVGDRLTYLDQALQWIEHMPGVSDPRMGKVYETAAVGPVDQGSFLNAAARLETDLEPVVLLERLREIETELGRPPEDQRQRWGPRVIDLDILLFGERVIDQPGLQVPHPRMHERWFVLQPMADIAPDVMHPVLGKTIGQLLGQVTTSDQSRIRRGG